MNDVEQTAETLECIKLGLLLCSKGAGAGFHRELFHPGVITLRKLELEQRTGRTRKGNQALRQGLIQAAHAAAHTKNTYLAAQYHRLAARRGSKRAIVAVAHSMLVIAYWLLSRHEPYRELGGDYFDRQRPAATAKRLVQRLENLGYHVILEAPPQVAVAAG